MTDPATLEKEAPRQPRRLGWIWIWAGVFVSAVLLLAYVIFRYDCAPPDDAWMIPAPFAAASGPHSIPELVKTSQASLDSADKETAKLPEPVRKADATHLAEVKAFLEKYRATLAEWDAFVAANQGPLPFPGGDGQMNFGSDCTYLTMFQQGAKFAALRARLLALEGDVHGAVEQSLTLLRLGHQLSREGSFLIQWLVAITIQAYGRAGLEYTANLHSFDEADMAQIEKTLAASEITPRDFKATLQGEYLSFKRTFAEFQQVSSMNSFRLLGLPDWAGLTVKPNLTRATLLELERPIFAACDKDWREVYQTAQKVFAKFLEKQDQPVLRYLSANIGGNMLIGQLWEPWDGVYEKSVRSAAFHRQISLMLALRRFELEHGKLPATLQDLCPKYLPSVPLDPYDNAPMRWNATTQVVYSLGKDLKDDGGDVSKLDAPRPRDNKDAGMFYWWRAVK